jgi:hypothetical protein
MDTSNTKGVGEDAAYIFIYEKFVESRDDINGMIDYALYKREKIEFIHGFIDRYHMVPADAELKSFHLSSNTEARLNTYRIQAGVIKRKFWRYLLKPKLKRLRISGKKAICKARLAQISRNLKIYA